MNTRWIGKTRLYILQQSPIRYGLALTRNTGRRMMTTVAGSDKEQVEEGGGGVVLSTSSQPTVPILPCTSSPTSFIFHPSKPPLHPLHSPRLDTSLIPASTLNHLTIASSHLHAERLVVIPTETVYGLGANTLSPLACRRVYALKGRPSDNPLIVHISGLGMLDRLVPDDYTIPVIYQRLIDEFWPGPLTLLFPHRNPPPAPAPQTVAVRFPAHYLARALIGLSGLPISAPSANSSGRPSPTEARHVGRDLGVRGARPDEHGQKDGRGVLGCILDAGACEVGLESTVVDATGWDEGRAGGTVKVLRPGGVGVESLERVVRALDEEIGSRTRVWVYGRDRSEEGEVEVVRPTSTPAHSTKSTPNASPPSNSRGEISNPSTPGMKYKHYSPSVPVFLLYPSDTFGVATTATTDTGRRTQRGTDQVDPHPVGPRMGLFINKKPVEEDGMRVGREGEGEAGGEVEKGEKVGEVLRRIVSGLGERSVREGKVRLGVMAFEQSRLRSKIEAAVAAATTAPASAAPPAWDIEWISLGHNVDDAARRLFGGMLQLEGRFPEQDDLAPGGVDAILIEATGDEGLGLAFMERAGKAVGGGGGAVGLGSGSGSGEGEVGMGDKRFLVDVE